MSKRSRIRLRAFLVLIDALLVLVCLAWWSQTGSTAPTLWFLAPSLTWTLNVLWGIYHLRGAQAATTRLWAHMGLGLCLITVHGIGFWPLSPIDSLYLFGAYSFLQFAAHELLFWCWPKSKTLLIYGCGPLARDCHQVALMTPANAFYCQPVTNKKAAQNAPKGALVIDASATGLDIPGAIRIGPEFFLGGKTLRLDQDYELIAPEWPSQGLSGRVKRSFDLAFVAAAALPALVAILGVIPWLWWRQGRPLFYSQQRVGLSGQLFSILKLRSMNIDAEEAGQPVWPTDEDARMTPAGKTLRRFWLDEIPQIINILKGDMSLVGPRPERQEFAKVFTEGLPKYPLRHNARAGLTGFAQVCGYVGNTSLRKRLSCDLYYLRNWSPCFDLVVVAKTICQLISRTKQPRCEFVPGEGGRIP